MLVELEHFTMQMVMLMRVVLKMTKLRGMGLLEQQVG